MADESPRIAPVARAEADPEQLELYDRIGPGEPLHLFGTLAHHPKLLRSWLPLGGRLLFGGNLDGRTRELTILRTAARCGSHYEWGQHVALGRDTGLGDAEILACADEVPAADFDAFETALLTGVDELLADHDLTEATWNALAERLDPAGLLEYTMVVGHYAMLAGMLRAARVAPDGAQPPIGSVTPTEAAP